MAITRERIVRERVRFVRRVASVTLGYFAWCTQPATASLQPEIAVSSIGAGVAASLPLKGRNDLRFEYDFTDLGGYKLTTNTNDSLNPGNGGTPLHAQLVFDDTFHAQNFSVVFDHHLNTGPLYVSAGLDIDGNHIDALSRPNQDFFQFGATTYPGDLVGPLSVHIRWNPIAPYLGFGFQSQVKSADGHVRKPRVELGALFQGHVRVATDASGLVAANPVLAGPYLAAFTAAVPSHIPSLAVYPVFRVSVPVGR